MKTPVIQISLVILSLFLVSCSTGRIITYEKISPKKPPYRITLVDSSEYRIFSYQAVCRADQDMVTIYNRRNGKTVEMIPKPSINEIISSGKIKWDSPGGVAITVILVILTAAI